VGNTVGFVAVSNPSNARFIATRSVPPRFPSAETSIARTNKNTTDKEKIKRDRANFIFTPVDVKKKDVITPPVLHSIIRFLFDCMIFNFI
jgi:hypothetical protein